MAQAGRTDDVQYRRRATAAKPQNAREHFVLALWCEKNQMKARAWKHHAVVLEIQPRHRASRRALGRLQPDMNALVRDALRSSNGRIRFDAVRALRRTRRPAKWFLPKLRSRSISLRSRAIRALGMLGDESAVKPLVRHLSVAGGNTTGAYLAHGGQTSHIQDFDVEIA
ncbi:MAG: HEAT repeat domain-containing protein [Planctomycetota bacterium]|jgi:HEAT repeat protein